MAGLTFTTHLTAGETVAQTVSLSGILPATHSLRYQFRWRGGSATVDAVASGDSEWTVTLPAATTLRIDPGTLVWSGFSTLTATGAVTLSDSGAVRVAANPTAETYEMRVLAAVRALIEGRATDGQVTTGLEGLQLEHLSPADLLEWEREYASRVDSQLRAMASAAGNAPPRRVYTRFVRAT